MSNIGWYAESLTEKSHKERAMDICSSTKAWKERARGNNDGSVNWARRRARAVDLWKSLKSKKPRRDAEAERKEDDRWRAGRPPTPPGRQENPQVHRYAADGLPVYKYSHLGMDQQDGGTPLCPFDCDCCF